MTRWRSFLHRTEHSDDPEPEPAHERCLSCDADLEGSRSYERYRVCHSCGFHFHLSARERVATLLDAGSFHEDDRGVTSIDPLSFQGRQSYRSRVINAQRRTGLAESALTGTGAVFGREVVVGVLDFAFLGGSIGVVAGERLARAFERAASRKVPVVTVCSTSGTRMQEGLLALMQAPRIAVAARKHREAGLPHIAIVTDPTTGSAYSGFVNMADIVLAEPNALVGYAALKVLQQTEAELPAGAHASEGHLRRGLVDGVVPRPALRDQLGVLLDLLSNDIHAAATARGREDRGRHSQQVGWQQLQLSRHEMRPNAVDFIGRMMSSFVELHGDRMGGDDGGVVMGLGWMGSESVMVIGQVRPHESGKGPALIGPGGFRKARRAMEMAARFGLPVVTLVDTAGADMGLAAEEAGLGHAVAECMGTMLEVRTPTVAVIIGEANSEAAMAMAVADRVLMLDNAVYEVIRPEDAAQILYQEASRAGDVAERLRITSHDCLRMGIVDRTVAEPGEGAHTNHAEAALLLRREILRELGGLQRLGARRRLDERYHRYREMGSTRSWLRGTLERRFAHLTDRIAGLMERVRRRGLGGRRTDYGDRPDIPV